jgi:hypothetical protein
MDEKLKIKIFADQVYPLTVDFNRKKALRSASKKIDKMIKQFEEIMLFATNKMFSNVCFAICLNRTKTN